MVNINRKQYDSREISKLWGIVIMILTSMIVAVFTCLYVYFYEPPIYILLTLGGILAGVGGIILFKIYRHNRRLEKVDKGNKLLVIEQRVIDILPKDFMYALAIVHFLLGICIVAAIILDVHTLIPLVSLLICNVIIFIVPRKYEIYERGIRYGMVFVRWEDIKEIKWEKAILIIKADKISPIKIRDKDGKIKEMVDNLVRFTE
jgi:hypothetical protein